MGDLAYEWSELKTIGAVKTIRQENGIPTNAEDFTLRYYISSAKRTAQVLLESTRAHRSIENQLHRRLDTEMCEDECQIIRDEGAENLAVSRHVAINLLTADKSFKAGKKRKQNEMNGIINTYRKSLQAAELHDFALVIYPKYISNPVISRKYQQIVGNKVPDLFAFSLVILS